MTDENPLITARTERTRWFLHDRFGMFIHWGLYAIPARGEWVRSVERISNEAYQPYFEEFNPARFDPRSWATLARQAGMKYAVLTAKHHDGFCLFDSQLTDYKSTATPCKRDLVREYLEAFRAEGLKVGLYYSLLDWHPPDYPAYGDRDHPMRDNEAYKNLPQDFSRYIAYMHGQVRELLTNYGRIDIIWYDFSYDNMSGETWKATELVEMTRTLQPGILIDNRLAASGEGNRHFGVKDPPVYAGDFACPEQIIPPDGLVDEDGRSVPWEACMTMNKNWGYAAADKDFKSSQQVVRALVECVSKDGNMLLNVGPDAQGEIPPESVKILTRVGGWMRRNAPSIYGCGKAEFPKPEWGRYTRQGNRLYAHVYDRGIGPVNFRGLAGRIRKARLLADGSAIKLENSWMTHDYGEDAFIDLPSARLPDVFDTVVELELL
jgi:alpha-L-fucosidase